MKLVSFLMPTRTASHESLRKAVQSIKETVQERRREEVEILLRIDEDDPDRLPVAQELIEGWGKVVIGPRGAGYRDMGIFVNDLLKVADSSWSFLVDDDAFIEGEWIDQLRSFSQDCAVNAQTYRLGNSEYLNGPNGGPVGLLIPTELAKSLPPVSPVDQAWLETILAKGWKVRQLNGTVYHHCGRAR